MSTNNICFYGELTKFSFSYHQIPSLSVLLLLDTKTSFICPNFVSRMSFLGLLNCNVPGAFIRLNIVVQKSER